MNWKLASANRWALAQGMIGRRLQSLLPSATAMGPNTYLSELDFLKMLGIAFVVHAFVFAIAAFFPSEKVTNIPVRALSFKLGDQDRIAAFGTPAVAPKIEAPPPAPVMQAASRDTWRATPKIMPKEATPAPLKPAPARPIVRPRELPAYAPKPKVIPITEPVRQMPVENRAPALAPLPAQPPAIAPTPQQYVREAGLPSPQLLADLPPTYPPPASANGAIGGQGAQTTTTNAAQTEQTIRERYTQQISGWIGRHQLYPAAAAGRAGRVVVRVRIDRGGYVRYYAIEESSGVEALDAAAIDMIRRANPMPAAPANYPAGNLIEFLIPISFRAPS